MQISTEEIHHRVNILNYLRLLRLATEPERRGALLRLLAEESDNAKRHGWTVLVG